MGLWWSPHTVHPQCGDRHFFPNQRPDAWTPSSQQMESVMFLIRSPSATSLALECLLEGKHRELEGSAHSGCRQARRIHAIGHPSVPWEDQEGPCNTERAHAAFSCSLGSLLQLCLCVWGCEKWGPEAEFQEGWLSWEPGQSVLGFEPWPQTERGSIRIWIINPEFEFLKSKVHTDTPTWDCLGFSYLFVVFFMVQKWKSDSVGWEFEINILKSNLRYPCLNVNISKSRNAREAQHKDCGVELCFQLCRWSKKVISSQFYLGTTSMKSKLPSTSRPVSGRFRISVFGMTWWWEHQLQSSMMVLELMIVLWRTMRLRLTRQNLQWWKAKLRAFAEYLILEVFGGCRFVLLHLLYHRVHLNFWSLRKDETEWCKYMVTKSKRASMRHVLEVQHLKEQHVKGNESFGWFWDLGSCESSCESSQFIDVDSEWWAGFLFILGDGLAHGFRLAGLSTSSWRRSASWVQSPMWPTLLLQMPFWESLPWIGRWLGFIDNSESSANMFVSVCCLKVNCFQVSVEELAFVAWTDYTKLGVFNQVDVNKHAQWMHVILSKNPLRALAAKCVEYTYTWKGQWNWQRCIIFLVWPRLCGGDYCATFWNASRIIFEEWLEKNQGQNAAVPHWTSSFSPWSFPGIPPWQCRATLSLHRMACSVGPCLAHQGGAVSHDSQQSQGFRIAWHGPQRAGEPVTCLGFEFKIFSKFMEFLSNNTWTLGMIWMLNENPIICVLLTALTMWQCVCYVCLQCWKIWTVWGSSTAPHGNCKHFQGASRTPYQRVSTNARHRAFKATTNAATGPTIKRRRSGWGGWSSTENARSAELGWPWPGSQIQNHWYANMCQFIFKFIVFFFWHHDSCLRWEKGSGVPQHALRRRLGESLCRAWCASLWDCYGIACCQAFKQDRSQPAPGTVEKGAGQGRVWRRQVCGTSCPHYAAVQDHWGG